MTIDERDHKLDPRMTDALRARRPAPSSDLEQRLRAAVARPRRPWILPALLASAVAAGGFGVLLAGRAGDDPGAPTRRAAPGGTRVEVTTQGDRTSVVVTRDDAGDDASVVVVNRDDDTSVSRFNVPPVPPVPPAPPVPLVPPVPRRVVPPAPPPPPPPAPPAPPAPPVVALGHLAVMTTPPSRVLVDGRSIGPTPARTSLTPGEHQLVLVDLDGGAVLQRRVVMIKAGETSRVRVQLPDKPAPTAVAPAITNKVVIDVPATVQVSIDGTVLGRGTQALDVPVGEHTIEVSQVMPDGATWTKTMRVRVVAGAPLVVQFTPPEE